MINVCLEGRAEARRNRFCRAIGSVLTAILLTANAFAQRDSTDSVIPVLGDASARWVVKIAPLFILDPDNTVQFGVERTLGGRSSVQVEGGYGWPGFQYYRPYNYGWPGFQYYRPYNYSDREVWRGRAEWRIYSRVNVRPRGGYFAIEGFYKQVNAIESGTIGRACGGGFNCQYFQQYRSTAQKFVTGGHLKWGVQFRLDDDWLFDLYLGVGLRSVSVQYFRPEFPDAQTYRSYNGPFNSLGLGGINTSVAPSATLGFKVGYVIR